MNAHPATSPDHQHSLRRLQLRSFAQDVDRCGNGIGGHRRIHIIYLRREMAPIARRQLDVLSQTAIDLAANHASLVLAQIIAGPIAPATVTTDQIVIHVHSIPGLEAIDIGTDLHYVSSDFMTDDAGELAAFTATTLTIPNQRQAEATGTDTDQHLARSRLGYRHVFEHERTI